MIDTKNAIQILTVMRDAYKTAFDSAQTALESALDCQKMEEAGREDEAMESCVQAVTIAMTIPIHLSAALRKGAK